MSQKLNRRTILQSIVAVAATTAFGCSDEETTEEQAEAARAYFPQSVASGDPRPNSVVLWTRAVDPNHANSDTTLSLEVSEDESFGQLVVKLDGLKALVEHDNAIKVKVTNLQPRKHYYYRFVFEHDGERFLSPVGRTKTAPAAGDDVPVRFVVGNCQDYVGRYYNSWQRLLQLNTDLDAIVFLGDYIYETTGDPAFQSASTTRDVTFTEPDGALVQRSGIFQYLAAASLSNYRDLYKNLRSDPMMQKVHERYAFINVWDDHEFSDDCWGSNATYEDGRRDEKQDERRRNAEQAFFEYLPIDTSGAAAEGTIDPGSEPRYPDTRIYRDFDFGQHVKLIVTDYRTYRPDHLIPEDAYPATVVMDAAVLTALGAAPAFTSELFAYVDIDAQQYAPYKGALQQVYVALAMQAGLSQAEATAKAGTWVKGNLALAYVNQVLAQLPEDVRPPPIPTADAPRGLAYLHMGKQGLFDIRGTRYIVVKDTYDLYAQYRYATSQKASENAWGTAQETWVQEKLQAANTWKVVVSSVSFTSLVWDLRAKADIPDPSLRQRFYFNADQWDGFPTKRRELLAGMKDKNVITLSGDIHASYASVEGGVPALTGPAISSGTVAELAGTAVVGAGYAQGSAIYEHAVRNMDATLKEGNPGLVFSNSEAHGFLVVELRANEALATYNLIPSSEVRKDYSLRSDGELQRQFTTQAFRIQGGEITPA
ncbi:MAG: alkaline phosphatase D family protein [Myxococcaceae bacterium]|nr:alkaline phosphatase D family protein [Myxococcaceae bacterium]